VPRSPGHLPRQLATRRLRRQRQGIRPSRLRSSGDDSRSRPSSVNPGAAWRRMPCGVRDSAIRLASPPRFVRRATIPHSTQAIHSISEKPPQAAEAYREMDSTHSLGRRRSQKTCGRSMSAHKPEKRGFTRRAERGPDSTWSRAIRLVVGVAYAAAIAEPTTSGSTPPSGAGCRCLRRTPRHLIAVGP
jgi:hypothetical protein